MIVKDGRLYLWKNNISTKQLVVKLGSGSGSNEYTEITDTNLYNVIEEGINISYSKDVDPLDSTNWKTSMGTIGQYLDETTRKITVHLKVEVLGKAVTVGELGLFVIDGISTGKDLMISKNLIPRQTLSSTESKVIKYTINI